MESVLGIEVKDMRNMMTNTKIIMAENMLICFDFDVMHGYMRFSLSPI